MTRAARALAAAVTPLSHDANAVDLEAVEPLVAFYAASGLDGLLVLGTTGEGVLLSPDERREVARTFLGFSPPRLAIIVHCGAQSTRDTVRLAADGAAGVAVIAPPYYQLDEAGLERHFVAAARAAEPLPFYVYEFAARTGYAVPPAVIERLRGRAPNLAGLKVSDSPFERVEPYLLPGLDVKRILSRRGVALQPAVRAPLRDLDPGESGDFEGLLAELEALQLTGSPSPR